MSEDKEKLDQVKFTPGDYALLENSSDSEHYAYLMYEQDGLGDTWVDLTREDCERVHAWLGKLLECKKKTYIRDLKPGELRDSQRDDDDID